MRTAPPDRDFLFNITHMVKKCLRGKRSMLVFYAHGTDYSNSVAIVRLADVAALAGRREHRRGRAKRYRLSLSWYASRPPPPA